MTSASSSDSSSPPPPPPWGAAVPGDPAAAAGAGAALRSRCSVGAAACGAGAMHGALQPLPAAPHSQPGRRRRASTERSCRCLSASSRTW
eukprot:scaffold23160_cov45-Phaeocystis_antarctica.AAC.1